jgi:hypothetical protein
VQCINMQSNSGVFMCAAPCSSQVQEWDAAAAAARAEAAGLAAERQAVDAAVEELRTMLMQSVAERSRLAGEAEAAEQRAAVLQRARLCLRNQNHSTAWLRELCCERIVAY